MPETLGPKDGTEGTEPRPVEPVSGSAGKPPDSRIQEVEAARRMAEQEQAFRDLVDEYAVKWPQMPEAERRSAAEVMNQAVQEFGYQPTSFEEFDARMKEVADRKVAASAPGPAETKPEEPTHDPVVEWLGNELYRWEELPVEERAALTEAAQAELNDPTLTQETLGQKIQAELARQAAELQRQSLPANGNGEAGGVDAETKTATPAEGVKPELPPPPTQAERLAELAQELGPDYAGGRSEILNSSPSETRAAMDRANAWRAGQGLPPVDIVQFIGKIRDASKVPEGRPIESAPILGESATTEQRVAAAEQAQTSVQPALKEELREAADPEAVRAERLAVAVNELGSFVGTTDAAQHFINGSERQRRQALKTISVHREESGLGPIDEARVRELLEPLLPEDKQRIEASFAPTESTEKKPDERAAAEPTEAKADGAAPEEDQVQSAARATEKPEASPQDEKVARIRAELDEMAKAGKPGINAKLRELRQAEREAKGDEVSSKPVEARTEKPWGPALSRATNLGRELEQKRNAGAPIEEIERLEREFLQSVNEVEAAKKMPGGEIKTGDWDPIEYLARRASASGINSERYRQLTSKQEQATEIEPPVPVPPPVEELQPVSKPEEIVSVVSPAAEEKDRQAAQGANGAGVEDGAGGKPPQPPERPPVEGGPTGPELPERAPERAETAPETGTPTTLALARETYAKAILRQRSWFSLRGNRKKELREASANYEQLLSQEKRAAVARLQEEFRGRDMQDERVVAEYAARQAEIAIGIHMTEQTRLREAMFNPERRSALESIKIGWRKNWKKRAIGGAVIGVVAAPVNMWMSSATWAMMYDGLLHGKILSDEAKKGEAKRLTREEVAGIKDEGEIDRRIAATTMRKIELSEVAASRRAHSKKGDHPAPEASQAQHQVAYENENLEMLQAKKGELLRTKREAAITEIVKGVLQQGGTKEAALAAAIENELKELGGHESAILARIGRNKVRSGKRMVASAGLGLLTGLVAHEAARHVAEWEPVKNTTHAVRDWFHQALSGHQPEITAGQPGPHTIGDNLGAPEAAHGVQPANPHYEWNHGQPPDWSENAPWRQAAETAAGSAQSSVEVAQSGDNLTTLAGKFLKGRFAEMSPEHQSRFAAYIQEAVRQQGEAIGVGDIHHIDVGQQVDFSKLDLSKVDFTEIGDAHKFGSMQELIEHVKGTSTETLKSIAGHDATLREWAQAHPGVTITTEKASEILHGQAADAVEHGTSTVAESATASAPVPDHAPMAEFYQPDENGVEHFQVPDTGSTPETVAPSVDLAQTSVAHPTTELAHMNPDIESEYIHYQTLSIDVPDAARDKLFGVYQGISVSDASQFGRLDQTMHGIEMSHDQRELLTTSLHKVSKSLLGGGFDGRKSLAEGLEWIRQNR